MTMAGRNGTATQLPRGAHDEGAQAPRVVGRMRQSQGAGHDPRVRYGRALASNLGPSHDLRAGHAVVWNRDARTAVRIGNALRRQSHTVHVVKEPDALHRCLRQDRPDVVIVDLDEFASVPRAVFGDASPPVVGLTTAVDPLVRARYLDLGADDVVPAPVSIPELDARVRAVLARTRDDAEPETDVLTCGTLELDRSTSRVRVRGAWVGLTGLELKLLAFLMEHPSRAFSREALLEKVWGFSVGDTSTVSVHVRRLRIKLEAEPARPVIIRTVWGVGYFLEPPTV
jgi:two-component system response regulator ResD